MNLTFARSTTRTLALCSALILSACTTPIEQMSAPDALKMGTNQLFEIPNYQAEYRTRLVDFQLNPTFSNQVGIPQELSQLIGIFGKKIESGATLIVNRPQQQFQMIPYYSFQSRNLNAKLQIPLVFDRNTRNIFADLSAFDGLINNADQADKYARFTVPKLPIPDDADVQLIGLMQKYAQLNLQDIPTQAFNEAPINAEDRKNDVVRKIQFDLSPTQGLKYLPDMARDLVNIMRPEPTPKTTPEPTSTAPTIAPPSTNPTTPAKSTAQQHLANSEASERTEPASNLFWGEFKEQIDQLIGKDSRDNYTVGLNRKGQIVRMTTLSDISLNMPPTAKSKLPDHAEAPHPNTEAQPFARMVLTTEFNLNDIGTARLINPPTTENSFDGMTQLQKSFLGQLIVAKPLTQQTQPFDIASEVDFMANNATAVKKSAPKKRAHSATKRSKTKSARN